MDTTLAGIVVLIIVLAAAGLGLYRLYLGLTENHEKAAETKQQNVITQDLKQGEEDSEKVKRDKIATDAAIAQFESDDK